jgi:putative endonuclease
MAVRRRSWSVYLVRRADGALYTGIALDVARRLQAHRAGSGAKALRGRGPLRLVLAVRVGDRGAALRIEARWKQLRKADKERLVRDRARARRWIAMQA